MDYKIGCLADLISGTNTPKKEVQKIVLQKPVKEKKLIEGKEPTTFGKNKRKKLRKLNELKTLTAKLDKVNEHKQEIIKSNKIIMKSNSEKCDKNIAHAEESNKRTVFVGNLPNSIKKIQLKKLFSKYGEIQSVRFRNAPLADPRTPKKVAIIKKEYHPKRTNIDAFVCFKIEESAKKALDANGYVIDEHHLRVDMATNEKCLHDNTKAIFIGNLDFSTEEDHLWSAFKDCGSIESVRIVRDKKTSMGKGFGYVNFATTDAVELALRLDGTQIKDRAVRIKRIQPNHNKIVTTQDNTKPYNIKKRDKFGNKIRNRTNRDLKRKASREGSSDSNKKVKLSENKSKTVFEGTKSEKKNKKSVNKGELMKRKMVKRLAPKVAS